MRSILLHVEDKSSIEPRLQTALALARATNGHLTCLHVTPVDPYVTFDGFGGVFVMGSIMEALDNQGESLKSEVEERLRTEDVSWEYQQSNGTLPYTLLAHAALADVVVTGRQAPRGTSGRWTAGQLGDMVLKARSPLLLPGIDGASFDPFGKAMIAWNGSQEAANAVRGALPLLKMATSIEVVRLEEEDEKDHLFPSTKILEYLSRHDLHAELSVEKRERQSVAAALIARAHETAASSIVLGGYGHSRFGEYVFGGVTRSMLASSPINLVMSH
jgi:nucleotide-binding universal stress UspA family protein